MRFPPSQPLTTSAKCSISTPGCRTPRQPPGPTIVSSPGSFTTQSPPSTKSGTPCSSSAPDVSEETTVYHPSPPIRSLAYFVPAVGDLVRGEDWPEGYAKYLEWVVFGDWG